MIQICYIKCSQKWLHFSAIIDICIAFYRKKIFQDKIEKPYVDYFHMRFFYAFNIFNFCF